MKLRDVAGKRIAAIRQGRVGASDARRSQWAVDAIVLEDGTELRFVTIELEGEYATDVVVCKPGKNVKI